MLRIILRKTAVLAVALCVCVTFIPMSGECDIFAAENGGQDVETPAADNIDESIPEGDPADVESTENNAAEGAEAVTENPEVQALDGDNTGETEETTEPEEPEEPVKDGLISENGATYYYKDGVMQTGAHWIDGALYYFFSNGKAVTAKNAWFKGSDSSSADRYALGGGKIAAGAKKITATVKYKEKYKKKGKWKTRTKTKKVTTLYWFNKTTGRTQAKGWFKDGSNSYYSKGGGKLAVKWNAMGKKAYYFYPNSGVQAKNTTIGYLKVPACGYLGEAYALGIKKLNSTKWTLRQAYKNSYKIRYQGRWWRQKTSEQYALKGFKKNKGNCYVMAATFYIQAKLLGYNVRQIHGKVAHRYPHSWTQIKKKGSKWRVYDPNFRNETGRNGWNIYYGKRGTWRYTNYSVFQN